MTYKLNTHQNQIPNLDYDSNMHVEGRGTWVRNNFGKNKAGQARASSCRVDPNTSEKGASYPRNSQDTVSPRAYRAMPVVTVAPRAPSGEDCWCPPSSSSLRAPSDAIGAGRQAVSSLPSTNLLSHVLRPQCVESSATGPYLPSCSDGNQDLLHFLLSR